MKIDWQEIIVNGEKVNAKITIKEKKDPKTLKKFFKLWLKLNVAIKSISTRGINFPEAISENAFCLFFPAIRIVKLAKGKCSFDCVDTNNGRRIQIKASSIKEDLTSFGPRSEWDDLYFLDFSSLDGSFKVFKIESDWVYNQKINKDQTFGEQQAQARRPRFSITKKLILPQKLQPIKICRL